MRHDRGFTLLEVLVALAIFALVAAAVMSAAGRSLINAQRLESLTLASWIADNRLTELQLQQPTSRMGREERTLEYAGRQWQILSHVQNTGTPGMLRVTVWVASAESRSGTVEDRALTRLVGFVGVPF